MKDQKIKKSLIPGFFFETPCISTVLMSTSKIFGLRPNLFLGPAGSYLSAFGRRSRIRYKILGPIQYIQSNLVEKLHTNFDPTKAFLTKL